MYEQIGVSQSEEGKQNPKFSGPKNLQEDPRENL